MQTYRADESASQDLFDGLARKLLSPTIQHKLITLTPLSPEERDQLIAAGKIVSDLQNALARFPSEGTLLTEEALHQYFQTHTIKATVPGLKRPVGNRIPKGRAFLSRPALAMLCEVDKRTIYNWDNKITAPEIDGYSQELRLKGGADLFLWVEDYRRFRQQPTLKEKFKPEKLVFLEGITEKDADFIRDYVVRHRNP